MTWLQRILLWLWAGVAVLLLVSGSVELWLLMEGAVRKPHNSRLFIALFFALGVAITAAVIGAWRGRADAFNALQALGLIVMFPGVLWVLHIVLMLGMLLTAEVRGWKWTEGLPEALLFTAFGWVTFFAFRLSKTPPSG